MLALTAVVFIDRHLRYSFPEGKSHRINPLTPSPLPKGERDEVRGKLLIDLIFIYTYNIFLM